MNNKLLLVIIVLIVVFGTFTFLVNKKAGPVTQKSEPMTSQETTKKTATQPRNPISTVTLTASGFTPKDIVVKAGTRVIWINKSGKSATVSSNNHPTHRLYPFLNLGEFADGSSVQVVFDKAGKYTYHDHYNAGSTGTVIVE